MGRVECGRAGAGAAGAGKMEPVAANYFHDVLEQ